MPRVNQLELFSFLSPTRTHSGRAASSSSAARVAATACTMYLCLPFRTRNNQSERARDRVGRRHLVKIENEQERRRMQRSSSLSRKEKEKETKQRGPGCHAAGSRYNPLTRLRKCVAESENHATSRYNFRIGWLLEWRSGWSGDCVGPRGRSFTRTITVARPSSSPQLNAPRLYDQSPIFPTFLARPKEGKTKKLPAQSLAERGERTVDAAVLTHSLTRLFVCLPWVA